LNAQDATGNFLFFPLAEGLPDFGQPLRDQEPVGADGPNGTRWRARRARPR
jgi:hypothetical protein